MNLFAFITWGMLVPLSLSFPTEGGKITMVPEIAFSLSCSELATINTRLDSLIRYAFPPEVPGDKAYAVQGFAHSYKFLINSMYHADCVAEAEMETVPMHTPKSMSASERDDLENYIMEHCHNMNLKRQSDQTTEILCLVINALLVGTGSEEGAASNLVARQETGIVQQLLTLLGQILEVVLGCDESDSA